jgi:hypothetical protein
LVIDILYKTADGRRNRYRKDAQVQTLAAAKAEKRRLIRELGQTGHLQPDAKQPDSSRYAFSDAVAHYRRTHAATGLRASTRRGYDRVIDAELVPPFGALPLERVDHQAVSEMDAELAADGLKPATRANVQAVLRSVLRAAVEGGLLDEMPRLPRLPRPGQSVVQTLHPDEVEAVVEAAESAILHWPAEPLMRHSE